MSEFEDASRRMHVLVGSDTGNSRFVHFYLFCDIPKDHRTHSFVTVFEKVSLVFDDTLRYFKQRIVADLQAANQPARLLQLQSQRGVIVVAADEAGISLIDPESGRIRRIDINDPPVVLAS